MNAMKFAAGMGMALAGYECRDMSSEDGMKYLVDAAFTLSHARPTTSARMVDITNKCIEAAKDAFTEGEKVADAIFKHTLKEIILKYERIGKTAEYLVDLFPDKGCVLTQCFGETIVGLMLKEVKRRRKDIKVMCAETRPYFQGARLTASVAYDQGFDITPPHLVSGIVTNKGIFSPYDLMRYFG